ncbi:MAG TPA: nucleotidyltransferase family protein [Herpetosiphonaceae bacterium]
MELEKQPDLRFGPEWALLEVCTLGLDFTAHQPLIESLLKHPDFDWGELLDQALRHRMAYILAYETTSNHPLGKLIPRYIRYYLMGALEHHRYTIEIWRAEAARIARACQAADVPIVATKGIALEATLYGGHGIRPLGDMDFMTPPAYNQAVLDIMAELGYQVGHYDRLAREIVPLSRREMLAYKLSPDHLPKLARLTGDRFIPFSSSDVANSLTWTASGYEVPLDEAFRTVLHQPLPGIDDALLPVFSPEYHFIFTILHFFREAWLVNDASSEKDVNLIKCSDVIRFWQHYPELRTPEFGQLLQGYGIVQPVLWVLAHLDRAFQTQMVATLGLREDVSEDWLASASAARGAQLTWSGTMRERLHCKNRASLFKPA